MEQKFAELYEKYYRYVYVLVFHGVPRKEDREEIISDVFVSLWSQIESLDEQNNIKSFIFLITKRRVADFLRKFYKLRENEINVILDSEFFTEDMQEDVQKSNEIDQSNIFRSRMQNLVKTLDQKYQLLFELKYNQNLPSSEIAKELNITKNYVKVMNNRLISKIKTLL